MVFGLMEREEDGKEKAVAVCRSSSFFSESTARRSCEKEKENSREGRGSLSTSLCVQVSTRSSFYKVRKILCLIRGPPFFISFISSFFFF